MRQVLASHRKAAYGYSDHIAIERAMMQQEGITQIFRRTWTFVGQTVVITSITEPTVRMHHA